MNCVPLSAIGKNKSFAYRQGIRLIENMIETGIRGCARSPPGLKFG